MKSNAASSSTTSSSSDNKNNFLPVFKTLLKAAGQVDVAFGNIKEGSEEYKNIEKWIGLSTTTTTELPLKDLDEQLKNKTFVASNNKLTAADVAVFGLVNNYIVSITRAIFWTRPSSFWAD